MWQNNPGLRCPRGGISRLASWEVGMVRMRDCIASLALFLCAGAAQATDVNVVGLFPGKAVVSINGGPPRTISVGQKTAEGVTLVSSDRDSATVDIDGKRRVMQMGQH